ncbi:hypothetical protein BDV97DRAFT_413079 [Delphinella strobiligena]|nr:hypothetical protein BDV97DRAFT_413079 [Delphinella strobiligena]
MTFWPRLLQTLPLGLSSKLRTFETTLLRSHFDLHIPFAAFSMLSRASSDAGIRLRRAKSSSSVSYKHGGISASSVDPRHAELAAAEAYRRAYKHDDPFYQAQPIEKPQRRQKRGSHRSEGSHFEAARTKDLSRSSSVKHSETSSRPTNNTSAEDYEGTVITRSRRVVNATTRPLSEVSRPIKSRNSSDVQYRIRKAKSAYYGSTFSEEGAVESNTTRHSILYPDTPYRTAIEAVDRGQVPLGPSRSPVGIIRKPTPREMQTDESIKVAAWDAYLQDFHQRKLNVRKSFIAPLTKRFTKDTQPGEAVRYDGSVPPYNLANETNDDVFSSSPVPPVQFNEPLHIPKPRATRTVSDSLKTKFKRLMSKSKLIENSIPVQHVVSKHLHFNTGLHDENRDTSAEYFLPLPPQASSPQSTTRTRKSSSRSSNSNGDSATLKSRVTSWTTSTGTGTIRTSGQGAALSSIDETGMTTRTDHEPKQNPGSFLGRALRLSLRRRSTMDLNRSSEDSQRLYDALRKEIQGPEDHTGTTTINDDVVATDTLVKEYLPPRYNEDFCNVRMTEPVATTTIRPVEPDIQEDFVVSLPPQPPSRPAPKPPSVVTRKTSWLHNARWSLPSQTLLSEKDLSTSRAISRSKTEAILPSQEQLANRLDKSQSRWQSTLEDKSPIHSRAMRYSMDEDNPYRLRSIPTDPQAECLPVAIRHGKCKEVASAATASRTLIPIPTTRDQVISPSVYSRTSDCRSTTPNDARGDGGTFITVTGREVKRYSLESPSKSVKEQSYGIKPSAEWKAWLNTELRDFDNSPAADELDLIGQGARQTPDSPTVNSNRVSQHPETTDSGVDPPSSNVHLSHTLEPHAVKTRRPVLGTRRSSIMNERYPRLDTGRELSSDRSLKSEVRPGISSRQSSSTSRACTPSSTPAEKLPVQGRSSTMNPTPILANLRPRVRQRHSAAILGASRQRSSLAVRDTVVAAEGGDDAVGSNNKSALDLRAVYRTTNNLSNSSINVRRKPVSVTLQDDPTLRKISEGPYGRASPANKENAAPSPNYSLTPSVKHGYGSAASSLVPSRSRGVDSRASKIIPLPVSGMAGGRGKNSPGQRMVDDFLSSRNGIAGSSPTPGVGELSPAFI